jgi:hypothetical protein
MELWIRNACLLAGLLPCHPKIPDPRAAPVEYELRLRALALCRQQEIPHVASKQSARFALRSLWFRPRFTSLMRGLAADLAGVYGLCAMSSLPCTGILAANTYPPELPFCFLGTLPAYLQTHDIAKFAIRRPGLADAGSVAATQAHILDSRAQLNRSSMGAKA